MVSVEEMESISKGFVPKNMAKNMKWAVLTFQQLIVVQNECTSLGESVDIGIPSRPVDKDSNCTKLCHVLCLFVVESQKTDYSPKTVYHLLARLLHYVHSQAVQPYPNFPDPKDVRFKKLQGTMESQ